MRILFISSANNKVDGISILVRNQAESLQAIGHAIEFFPIKGQGAYGYLKAILLLRKRLKNEHYDILHAHYSLSGIVAGFSGANPLVVSLMGSDTNVHPAIRLLIRVFGHYFWDLCIVKSTTMLEDIRINNAKVIPNGVSLSNFKPIDYEDARTEIGWKTDIIHILFASDSNREEKNYALFLAALKLLPSYIKFEIHELSKIPNQRVPVYLNASNVIALSSFWEGSPNIIKEAMACNRPIVSTEVGDVHWLFGETEGCYISSFEPTDYSAKLLQAIEFSSKKLSTNGRSRIMELNLDSESVANKIINIYNSCRSFSK